MLSLSQPRDCGLETSHLLKNDKCVVQMPQLSTLLKCDNCLVSYILIFSAECVPCYNILHLTKIAARAVKGRDRAGTRAVLSLPSTYAGRALPKPLEGAYTV